MKHQWLFIAVIFSSILCVAGVRNVTCMGSQTILLNKRVDFLSKNFPKKYPKNYRCQGRFLTNPGFGISMFCSVFDVYGFKRECTFGGVNITEAKSRISFVLCNNQSGIEVRIRDFTKTGVNLTFRVRRTHLRRRGFNCTFRPFKPRKRTTMSPRTTKKTTTSTSPFTTETPFTLLTSINATKPSTLSPNMTVITSSEGTTSSITSASTSDRSTSTPPFECFCGQRLNLERIVGGELAFLGEFPWQAAIFFDNMTLPECSGSLVTDKHILTAASCAFGWSTVFVKLGIIDTEHMEYGQMFEVDKIAVHPNYSVLTKENDIAVFTIFPPAVFTPFVLPICLPMNVSDTFEGQNCTVSGWGQMETGNLSSKLEFAKVTVLSNDECRNITPFNITDSELCAGDPEKGIGACYCDEGDPLSCPLNITSWQLAGVVSQPHVCKKPPYPDVYTRVTSFLDWIMEEIQNGTICPPKPQKYMSY